MVIDHSLDALIAGFVPESSYALPIQVTRSRNDLPKLFASAGLTVGAEIGVWEGAFSEKFCQANPQLSLVCVDPWTEYTAYNEKKNNQRRLDIAYGLARARLESFHCTILRMSSLEAAHTIDDGTLDFVYIDGNHREPFITQDLEAWAPKVKSGGVVSGHDYLCGKKHPHIEVVPAVNAYTEKHGIRPWYVLTGDKSPSWLWVVR